MTTLSTGSAAQIALAAGYALYASGTGTMQVAPPNAGPLIQIQSQGSSVGPFSIPVTVNLTASGSGVTYQIDQDSNPLNVSFALDPLTGGVAGLVSPTGGVLSLGGSQANGLYVIGGWAFAGFNEGGATNISETGRRISQPFKRNAAKLAMYFAPGGGQTYTSAGETPFGTPMICAGDIAWPAANTPMPFTVGGRRKWPVYADGPGVQTDTVDMYIPKGSAPAVRCFMRSLRPPTTPAAVAAAGGSIVANTYFIKLTSFCAGAESVASAEVTATTASTNLAIAITWQSHRDDEFVGIYIGTATGVNKRIAVVPAALGAFTLNSLAAFPVAGSSEVPLTYTALNPPTTYMSMTQSGEWYNRISGGSDGADLTGTSASAGGTPSTGPNISGVPTALLLADYQQGETDPCIYFIGDSISVGNGTQGAGGVYGNGLGGMGARSLWNRNKESWMSHGVGGSKLLTILDGTSFASGRIEKLKYSKVVYSQFGTNDFASGGLTWSQHAANQLAFARMLPSGVRLRLVTILPRTINTDFGLTNAAMTPDAYNATRILYNTWVRNGSQVDGSGAPVQSGGTPSPYIDGANYFDACAALEVNSSGVLTQNGGYWLTPSVALQTGYSITASSGFVAAALGTLTVTGTPFTLPSTVQPGYQARVVKVTSGLNAGRVAVINTHTTSVLTTYVNGLTGYAETSTAALPISDAPGAIPQVGDTFDIWKPYCIGGVHPSEAGYAVLETSFTAHLAALYG